MESSLLSVDEFRARLGYRVGRNRIYEAIREQDGIEHIRLGRKLLILGSEVDNWPLREAKKCSNARNS